MTNQNFIKLNYKNKERLMGGKLNENNKRRCTPFDYGFAEVL